MMSFLQSDPKFKIDYRRAKTTGEGIFFVKNNKIVIRVTPNVGANLTFKQIQAIHQAIASQIVFEGKHSDLLFSATRKSNADIKWKHIDEAENLFGFRDGKFMEINKNLIKKDRKSRFLVINNNNAIFGRQVKILHYNYR